MKTSLIITTYNWPKALELTILSCFKQSILPNEIIIADDGSDESTAQLIKELNKKLLVPIIHSWQEDKGFRAAESRNKAIVKAQFDYIIIVDGDMILDKDFIKNHLNNSLKNYFIQGFRVLINEQLTDELLNKNITTITFFAKGIKNRKNAINNDFLAKIFRKKSNSMRGIKTCNMSFWRKDLLKINGFNQDFIGWGREDSELVARLYNSGIKRLNVRFNCNAYHLFHVENDRKMLATNDNILQEAVDQKIKFCKNGLNKGNA